MHCLDGIAAPWEPSLGVSPGSTPVAPSGLTVARSLPQSSLAGFNKALELYHDDDARMAAQAPTSGGE